MKTDTLRSFEKDISKISDKKLAARVLSVIQTIESCGSMTDIPHLKKLQHAGNYYRIKVGSYRIGFKIEDDVVVFMRFLDRKDIYKYFP